MKNIAPTTAYLRNKIDTFLKHDKDTNKINETRADNKQFDLTEKTIHIDQKKFLASIEAELRNIKKQCTPGIGGRIPILEQWQTSNFSFTKKGNEVVDITGIEGFVIFLNEAKNRAAELGWELGADFTILQEQVNKISFFNEFCKNYPEQPVSSLDLLLEIERIEQRISRANVSDKALNAVTLSLRSASDDTNTFMLKLPGPEVTHGILAGASSALVDFIGSFIASTSPVVQQVEDKINKLTLLLLIRSYLTSNSTLPPGLEPRIDAILKKRRSNNIFKTPNSYYIKEQLKAQKVAHNTNSQIEISTDVFTTKLINFQFKLSTFACYGNNSQEILDSLKQLLDDHSDAQDKTIQQKINNRLGISGNIYDYLWQTLNNPVFRHSQRRDGTSLRRVYFTPLEALQRLLESNRKYDNDGINILGALINNLSEIKQLTASENNQDSNHYKKVHNYLFDSLERADKNNVIATMHKVILAIYFQPNLNNTEKNKLYHELMALRLDTNHGNLFKVANITRKESLFKKVVIDFLRYGSHNLSTATVIVGDTSKLYADLFRWETFHGINVGASSSAYRSYIEHSHTLNSVIQLHEFACSLFLSNISSTDVVDKSENIDRENNTVHSDNDESNHYSYCQFISLYMSNNKILPNFYHQLFKEKLGNKLTPEGLYNKIIDFSMLAAKYDHNFKQALNKSLDGKQKYDGNCSTTEFEHIAYLVLHNAQNPLISLACLSGFAAQDKDEDQRWTKMIILVNLLNSVNDSRSILYRKFSPSVAKTFMTEMLVSTLVAGIYATNYALLPLAAIPILVVSNWLRIGASDSRTIHWILGKISKPNRKVAANTLITLLIQPKVRTEPAHTSAENPATSKPNMSEDEVKNKSENKVYDDQLAQEAEQEFIQALTKRNLVDYLPLHNNKPTTKSNSDNNKADKINTIIIKLEKEARAIIDTLKLEAHSDITTAKIDTIVKTLHLTENTTQEQLLRKLLLLSYIVKLDTCENKIKIQLLSYLLYGIQFGMIAASLRQSSIGFKSAFIDKKNLINTFTTLAPYASSHIISHQIISAIVGLAVDATGSLATNLMSTTTSTKEFTGGYAAIMKVYKQQLLSYVREECNSSYSLQQDSPLIQLVYGALGAHRSRWGYGKTDSQRELEYFLNAGHRIRV